MCITICQLPFDNNYFKQQNIFTLTICGLHELWVPWSPWDTTSLGMRGFRLEHIFNEPKPRVVELAKRPAQMPDPKHVYNIFLQQQILLLTVALKVLKEPLLCMDLSVGGTAESTRHNIEIHWPLFRESPTNISLLFLSFSSNAVALNLINIEKSPTKLKNILLTKPSLTSSFMYVYERYL